jgi:glucose/arabinose dehydrogenase
MSVRFRALFCGLLVAGAARPGSAQITNPVPTPIPASTTRVELATVATGLVAPNYLTPAPGDASRLFVVDQAGKLRVIQNGALAPDPFLDVASRLVPLGFFGTHDENDFDERGLLGLAFHPGYADPASPGHRKLYTYTSEPLAGPADFSVPLPAGKTFNHQSVIAEWGVDPTDPNRVDPTSRREVLRIDEPQFNHNGGMLDFGPDGNLYIALGDGGQANDVGDGHGPLGNGQDLETVLGKILRIDVNGRTSANGQYAVPPTNPYAGATPGVDEIFASGFRNPFRTSFDSATGDLIVADVGQNAIEEIDRVTLGGNYGWRWKEGTFRFLSDTGQISTDLTGLPPGLIDPIAQYDHDEGISIIGGFVYHGTAIPELAGKYVFGDFSRRFRAPEGRLLVADLSTGAIESLLLGPEGRELGLFVKGFGQGPDGELYLLAGKNLGPFGSGGNVYRITAVPEPTSVALVLAGWACLGGQALAQHRRARARLRESA